MKSGARLPVILLWHMHQPQYRDALTGQYTLPWTYLHAIKDYTDMAAHLEANPAARAVVNFTPVLIEQVEEIARRIAEHLQSGAALPDPVLALLGPQAVPLEPAPRLALLRACLRGHRQHMIERFGPYLELATIAERSVRSASATPRSVHPRPGRLVLRRGLVRWCGTHPVARLTERGRDFTAAQRWDSLAPSGSSSGRWCRAIARSPSAASWSCP
jgi:hypothetical protein